VAHHVNLDLNTTSLADVLPPELRRSCDLVLCGEVVEHLFADPAEIIGDVLELVAPGGVLVVTTPNYLGLRSLRAMEKGLNPASRFSRAEGNVDAHYHLREYTMSELEDAAVAAGGRVELAAFSACWDQGDQIVEQWSNRQVRGNLVIVVSRAGDDAANAVQRWRRARGA
jgi:SAM-dependent methyltransferase